MASPIVKIKEGQLQGTQKKNFDGENFYAFLNVPFAKPPLGKLRFKAPELVEPWNGIRNAAKEGNICIQKDNNTNEIKGSEDCLNLHVYTRTLPSEENKLKPVMVWIHGGAFKNGSNEAARHGPEYLLTEDIVLVIPNYRLGIYGFAYFNDVSLNVPGNAGLKDQRMALEWVQRNIRSFNGDPNNVTLIGESAGAVSIHCQVLSPSTKGFFHKAILLSGTLLSPRPYRDDTCMQLVRKIQPNVDTEAQALEVLQQLSTEELLQYQEKFCKEKGVLRIFGPTIEYPNETALLTSHPGKLIVSGQYNKIPIIFGYCDREGLLMKIVNKSLVESDINLDDFIHPDMELELNDPNRLVIKKKLAHLYLQPPYNEKEWIYSDYEFIAGIIGCAKIYAKASSQPVYLYRMSIDAGLNTLKKTTKLKSKGVCHADYLGYLFYMDETSLKKVGMYRGDIETTAMRRFVKLFTNFAKTSNPTPPGNDLKITWKPVVDQNEVYFLDLNTELTLHTNPESERMDVWKEIFQLSPNTSHYL